MTLTLSNEAVTERLAGPIALDLAAAAAALSVRPGAISRPDRAFHPTNHRDGKFGLMPVILHDPPLLGLKVINIFPENAAQGLPTHLGLYHLFSGETGAHLLTVDAALLTGIRTAAMTTYAISKLARRPIDHVAIVGTGVQARWHAYMIGRLLKPVTITVAGRNRMAARQLSIQLRDELPTVVCYADAVEVAVGRADVVCTVTAARRPVVRADWIRPGTMIAAIGAHDLDHMELEPAMLSNATLYSDDVEAVATHCAEEAHLTATGHAPREWRPLAAAESASCPDGGLTIYKSFGTAEQDIVFSSYLIDPAATRQSPSAGALQTA